jgi:hypothetical protein
MTVSTLIFLSRVEQWQVLARIFGFIEEESCVGR